MCGAADRRRMKAEKVAGCALRREFPRGWGRKGRWQSDWKPGGKKRHGSKLGEEQFRREVMIKEKREMETENEYGGNNKFQSFCEISKVILQ